jgi:hypothetical protein
VGGPEDLGQFHANRRQLIDVEEAAVVDLLGGDAAERQPVRLVFDQERATGRNCARRPTFPLKRQTGVLDGSPHVELASHTEARRC